MAWLPFSISTSAEVGFSPPGGFPVLHKVATAFVGKLFAARAAGCRPYRILQRL